MIPEDIGHRFQNGGEPELEEVIDLFADKLLRYANTILCDYQDAENVVQDTFLSAFENRSSFDGNNLSGWLYKITYHKSLNQLKKRKLLWFREISINETVTMMGIAVNDREFDEFSLQTFNALKRLKPKERALLHARIIENMSYQELSYTTGDSEATLRKRYERAKNKMITYLNQESQRKEQSHELS